MKILKGISLFFIIPCIILAIGIYIGCVFDNFFYPGEEKKQAQKEERTLDEDTAYLIEETLQTTEEVKIVSAPKEEILNADTEYIIEEYDTKRDTLVETSWDVPAKYLGMNRDEFIQAMELYALSPPLSEQERGFVGLEVVSFSSQRVVIRMNYAYVEPSSSFYLKVENNSIVVYCDDNETVYMYTDITADMLPEYIQTQVIMGMFMKDEAALYNFLETYSS